MTLHEAMPDYDVREYHQTVINASREEVYRTMKTMDFRASEIVRALLWIRSGGREAKSVTLETFWKRGFLLLSDVPNKEVLLAWWVVSGRPLVAFRRFHPTSSFPSKTRVMQNQRSTS